MSQGRPRPRKTLTQLEPVMLPMEASALESACAAVLDAKRSGIDVPSATKTMALIAGSRPMAQPKRAAKSPTNTVRKAMKPSATQKAAHPPSIAGGGTSAKSTFQTTVMTWIVHCSFVGFSPSSAPGVIAQTNCSFHSSMMMSHLSLLKPRQRPICARQEVSFSSSLRIVTCACLPRLASSAPGDGLERTTRNVSAFSYLSSSIISMSSSLMSSPGSKVMVPDAAT
mmetsp:Transcript_7043/g.15503  ORF Transcript_7043/g.15503 Transcript_7043/m.15503 type:complete len:226 (-) Transcript_7043:894-1571(-)